MSMESRTLTVQDVLDWVPCLGIPHFQRGLVWGTDSVAALLESLFFETPCGSFVFWSPTDCDSYGVPLDEARGTGIEHLIIDGQQRIRSLYSAFANAPLSQDESEDDEGQDDSSAQRKRVWCINLVRVPGYVELLQPQGRDFALFVYTSDPATRKDDKRPPPLLRNVVPLQLVLQTESWTSPELAVYRQLIKLQNPHSAANVEEKLSGLYDDLHRRVLDMKARPFFASIQRKDDPAEMANLYNRINAGGKRVEVEERAFAKLVGMQPRTYEQLTELFAQIHGDPTRPEQGSSTGGKKVRDALLLRQKERAFGFKLFIRVFLQVCQHHFGHRQRKTDFSFDLVRKDAFIKAFKGLKSDDVERLWAETRRVLGQVRLVLREELFCDDLRSLPDTTALTPIFQILINYPALCEQRYKALLAGLCLRLVLADVGSKEIARLISEAADPGRVAFEVIPGMLHTSDREARRRLRERLQKANSIQSRDVLLLYWLERRLRARDFLYENINPESRRPKKPELRLEEAVDPEKQHIVPFSKAKEIYRQEVRRTESHPFNNIGNVTYISRLENHFETGLGDDLVDLQAEPIENQLAHLLKSVGEDANMIPAYEAVRAGLEGQDSSDEKDLSAKFEKMIALRRDLIRDGFQTWLTELDRKTCSDLGIDDVTQMEELITQENRVEPVRPMFADEAYMDVAHLIRGFYLGHAAEDRLVALAKRARKIKRPTEAKPSLELCVTKRQRVWFKVNADGAFLRFRRRVSTQTQNHIRQLLGLPMTSSEKIPLNPVPDFSSLLDGLADVEEMIERDMAATKKKAE